MQQNNSSPGVLTSMGVEPTLKLLFQEVCPDFSLPRILKIIALALLPAAGAGKGF